MHKIENNVFISVDDELQEKRIVIPEGVTEIADKAFRNYKKDYIKEIVFPSTLKKIGDDAFCDLSVEHYDLPEGLIEIGKSAFKNNANIKDITIPKSVKIIKRYAFSNCKKLKTVLFLGRPKFEEYVFERTAISEETIDFTIFGEIIPRGTFYEGTGLNCVTIPKTVNTIGDNAFAYSTVRCVDLGSVEYIQERAFAGCKNLKSISLPNTLKEIPFGAFSSCILLKDVKIGSGVKSIGREAFSDSASLEHIEIPENVESIGSRAFYQSKLKIVEIKGKPRFEEGVFEKTQLETMFDLSIFGDEIPARTFHSVRGISEVVIPECIKTIGEGAFCYSSIKDVTLTAVKSIKANAFSGCTRIDVISIPDSVEEIGEFAFERTSIQSISLPNHLKTISTGLFQNCQQLKKVDIPDTVESIQTKAFAWCQIEKLVLPNNLKTLGRFVFQKNPLEYIILPSSLTEIGEHCFMETQIRTILIPPKVSMIPESCFCDCSQLETVYILGETTIEEFAFMYCDNLRNVVGHKLTEIKEFAFREDTDIRLTICENCIIEENGIPENAKIIRKDL